MGEWAEDQKALRQHEREQRRVRLVENLAELQRMERQGWIVAARFTEYVVRIRRNANSLKDPSDYAHPVDFWPSTERWRPVVPGKTGQRARVGWDSMMEHLNLHAYKRGSSGR